MTLPLSQPKNAKLSPVPARHDTRDAGICDSFNNRRTQTRQDAILDRDIQPIEKSIAAYPLPLSGGLNGIVDGVAHLHRSDFAPAIHTRQKYVLAFFIMIAYTTKRT